jgi:hypothetical protein
MDARRLVSELLVTLGRDLGLENLTLASDDTLTLRFDERVMALLAVQEQEGTLLLLAPLPVPDAAGMRQALLANFLWRETAGATLALEPETGQLALQQRLPLQGLDYPTFSAAIEVFVDMAARQTDALAASAADRADGMPDAQPVAFDPRFIV